VAARQWAQLNPLAYARDPLSIEQVLASRMVSDPLSVLDCCLVTDGGGALVLVRSERAKDFPKPPVYVLGAAAATWHRQIGSMPDLTVTAAAESGPRAFAMAGLAPKDVDVLELYDAFTINTLLFLEDLGFCAKGEGGAFVRNGRIAPGGSCRSTPMAAACRACHPGMYGMFLLIEAVQQAARRGRRAPGAGRRDRPVPWQRRRSLKPGDGPAGHGRHRLIFPLHNQETFMNKGIMLQDKVAVVTGAAGASAATSHWLMAAQGAKVVVNDIGASVGGEGSDASPASRWSTRSRPPAARPCSAPTAWLDLAHGQPHHRVRGRHLRAHRHRGQQRRHPARPLFFNMSPDEWSAVIDVHLNGSFFTSRAAAPHFKTQKSGAYVHMTSTSGLIGNLGQANYAAAKLGIVACRATSPATWQRYNVRSNCISPFAWSRMIGSIPTDTPEQQARVEKLKKLGTEQIAPMATFLASDAAADVTAQIFAVRGNEIFLMSQSRPIRGMHTAEGWTPETIAERVLPAMKQNFYPLESSNIVFSWDPV
jgi:NAD(P)-dependent dehydrogenase (short-subunit alcohol dehydrogenase family)